MYLFTRESALGGSRCTGFIRKSSLRCRAEMLVSFDGSSSVIGNTYVGTLTERREIIFAE
ncbi:hypothetical protein SAMN04488577_3068 [Bacillus sp. cl95]|nr:hypothetical protein SAMN02799634_10552 [Bacillus sp. UNCCL13]SFQ87547.1 hypothetical protein SAMN04488577_3068 [Bacillus sp. cl95]